MSKTLAELDKQLISTIGAQVGLLLSKSASDPTIINTLIDFIPETKCLINGDNDKLLELHCMEYKNFAYFVQLLETL